MIIVTGASGQLGSQIVHRLLERVPGDRVGVSVRDTERTADLAARGVRVRRGDFAAAVLTDHDRPTSETPVLTAADAVDLDDVATILSDLIGSTICRVVVEDEKYVAGLAGHGVPEPAARMFLNMFQAARHGEFAVTDPTLASLVGHEPQPIRTVLQAATAAH